MNAVIGCSLGYCTKSAYTVSADNTDKMKVNTHCRSIVVTLIGIQHSIGMLKWPDI